MCCENRPASAPGNAMGGGGDLVILVVVGNLVSVPLVYHDTNMSRVIPGTPNDGTPENGKRDPYYSHIFRDSNMGVLWE